MALGKDHESPIDYQNTSKDILETKTDSGSHGDLEADRKRSKFGTSNRAVGARIAPVLPHLKAYDFGSDDSNSDIAGRQIELEADNAIQYRTCSWQKV